MWTQITCSSPSLSIEDILRLVLVYNGTSYALRVTSV